AVLRRPAGGFPAPRVQDARPVSQFFVLSALFVFSGPVSPSSDQKIFSILSEGQRVRSAADIHAFYISRSLQSQHIGSLLVHPGKIHPREINKRIVRRKDNAVSPDAPTGCADKLLLYFCYRAVLIDCQSFCKSAQEFQRMELRLMFKSHSSGTWNGDLYLLFQRCADAEFPCSLTFLNKLFLVIRIDIGSGFFQITVNLFPLYSLFEFFYCLLIGPHIFFRGIYSLLFDK